MNKPRYMEDLLKIIFLWIGIAFIFTGFLCFIGALKPKESSMIQVPMLLGIIFSLIGVFFVIVQTVLKVVTASKKKLHAELLASGTRINGIVENVYLQKYTHYIKQSPYRILYTYTHQGKEYHHKSCLLWDKPNVVAGDSIVVYTNDFGKSAVEF